MQKVAIFDIDGTIFRSSLLIELVEVLIEKDIFPISVREKYHKEELRWLDRKGDYDSYVMAVVGVFMEHIKGVRAADFARATTIVNERYKDRTYRYPLGLIKMLKAKGYYLLAISQSPKGVLDDFCLKLGFDKVYGRIYEIDASGHFTGRVVDEDVIRDKANIVHHAVTKRGLTLKGSIGVGDTEGDISMLELMETPICFNPNLKLYEYGKKKNWNIVVERKDVVYEFSEATKNATPRGHAK